MKVPPVDLNMTIGGNADQYLRGRFKYLSTAKNLTASDHGVHGRLRSHASDQDHLLTRIRVERAIVQILRSPQFLLVVA